MGNAPQMRIMRIHVYEYACVLNSFLDPTGRQANATCFLNWCLHHIPMLVGTPDASSIPAIDSGTGCGQTAGLSFSVMFQNYTPWN